jgi:hypothetical protein
MEFPSNLTPTDTLLIAMDSLCRQAEQALECGDDAQFEAARADMHKLRMDYPDQHARFIARSIGSHTVHAEKITSDGNGLIDPLTQLPIVD